MNRISITCPKCGHRIEHEYATMDDKTELECPECGERINVAARVASEMGRGLGLAARAIARKLRR